MNRETIRARIEEIGIVPAVRLSSTEDAMFAAEAVCSSGIPIVEVTMTVPGAVKIIHSLTADSPDLIAGAGSVLDVEMARRCLDAGARFLTTTGVDLELIEFAQKKNVVVFPGACTPTEITVAWKAGSDFVKVFPCSAMGGASYIRALRGPFPTVPFIAAGGVNQTTVSEFILAGANAVGIGGDLIHQEAIRRRERDWIRELSRRYANLIKQARNEKSPPKESATSR
ncbi:MAG TPA: bifunctional 4-hydroxy-2-oxoglutarate aldolase/2-dehydro-3-deoxy-phosphogluconate aldolase [Bryobacteraceae bacterium]|jgi:2-dehydro-3-deoxyphosphogluconate aldolase/(4S)-4-hydroxy-2-oxoglutarate aldolase